MFQTVSHLKQDVCVPVCMDAVQNISDITTAQTMHGINMNLY